MHRKNEGRDTRYTPAPILEAIRKTMGTGPISLDPCGSADPKKQFARATITEEMDGLIAPWCTRSGANPKTVFVNPPGSLIRAFAERFVREFNSQTFGTGAFLNFNHDHTTRAWTLLTRVVNCYPLIVMLDRRWKFADDSGKLFEVGRSHSIVCVSRNRKLETRARKAFEGIGTLWHEV